MSFLKNLFGSKKPKQEVRGTAPIVSEADQDATRERMEAEVARSKEERAAKGATDAEKDGSA